MALSNETHDQAVGDDSWSWPGRLGLVGFVVQAVGASIIWVVADGGAGRGWSNRDFQDWATFSIVLAVLLTTLGGVLDRRWRTALTVAMSSLLATALGCAGFVGYAVVNSA